MSMIFIFIGWFIISALWGFIPLIEPLRLSAISSPTKRRIITAGSAMLAFLTGLVMFVWMSCYAMLVISAYDSHADSQLLQGLSQTDVKTNIVPAVNEMILRQLSLEAACLSIDPTVCAMASRALQFGSPLGMLPIISAATLFPALAAGFLCWKLTVAHQSTAD